MKHHLALIASAIVCGLALEISASPGGSRLSYLDERSPFHAGGGFPRLTTPMWFGEDGVEAVVILSIDDMTDSAKYAAFLEPILARLAKAEERSPLSIFTCRVTPGDPRLETFLRAGVHLDVHTRTHPCPLLKGTFENSIAEVFDCFTDIDRIEGGRPAAFRMPCCDSINSASPRFFSEILPHVTPAGGFLEADSSVLMFLDESTLAYAPFRNYAATARDYPYPYVIGKLIWEFPIIAPTDWQAQNIRGPFHAATVADIKAGIDRVVEARGVFTFCFHPHGWIRNEQVVEIVDHALRKHGRKLRFLSFHDALERIRRNALGGVPLRDAGGGDNGVRLLDVDADGFLDVVIGNDDRREARIWLPGSGSWRTCPFPFRIVERGADGRSRETGVKFGVLRPDGRASALISNEEEQGLAHFDGSGWALQAGFELPVAGGRVFTSAAGRDRGVRLRDADGDGFSDLLLSNETQNAVLLWDERLKSFAPSPHALPGLSSIAGAGGEDRGLRFHDLDQDGKDDAILSNDDECYIYLHEERTHGWTRRVLHAAAGAVGSLPKFVSGGRDMGAWIKDRVLYVMNEGTAGNPDLVETQRLDRRVEHMASLPLEPGEALKHFHVPEGFRVELFAAEPLVMDPVSLHFAPDGRVWVVEMGTYPLGEGSRSGGRVRVLRDRDGDGRADESVLFASGLTFPTGALAFGRGALVTCAPDILYLEDLDGDGRADMRRAVFTGFVEGNQQHRVNGLHFGLDNWIHGANGESGGEITIPGSTGAPVRLGGRDFRFRRDLTLLEPESGRSQFGIAMDDFGDSFSVSNGRHAMYAVLPDRYLARNPHHAAPDPVIDIPDHGAMARVFPISKELISLNDIHVPGHFSSACGISVYRGDAFPRAYHGSLFVCEPVANLVHRDVLVAEGAAFRASRGEEGSDFLASSDNWFRPVFSETGPDGALWIADLYRYVVEHPQYIPRHLQEVLDITAGDDRGRIYRVVYAPAGGPAEPKPLPDLSAAPAGSLVEALDHPNGAIRDIAQRVLVQRILVQRIPVERGERSVIPDLRRLLGSASRPATRIHVLWTLEGLGALDDDVLESALRDVHPAVRRHAIRLAEPRLASSSLLDRVVALRADEDYRVRLQTAFSLGEAQGDAAAAALADILESSLDDRWMRAAVLSSSLRPAGALLARLAARHGKAGGREDALTVSAIHDLVRIVARKGDTAEIETLLGPLTAGGEVDDWHIALLAGLRDANPGAAQGLVLGSRGLARIERRAEEVLLDHAAGAAARVAAAGAARSSFVAESTPALLDPKEPLPLQVRIARALSRAAGDGASGAAGALLASWGTAGPALRTEILDGLLASDEGAGRLLDAVEGGAIPARDVESGRRTRLLERKNASLRERASRTLPAEPAPLADAMVDSLASLVARITARDAGRGREVFRKHCAPCHRLEGEGVDVGPGLAETRAKGEGYLLEAILKPSRMIAPRYALYALEIRGGRVATGLLESETATALTLLQAGGARETILRTDLVALEASSESLMPDDLAKVISPEDLAHLLAFLASQPHPLGAVPEAAAEAARRLAREEGHNGLAQVLSQQGRVRQASWLGPVDMPFVRQLDGAQELSWRTEPVPAGAAAGTRRVFRFPAALGYVSQPAGGFTLHVDGKKVLDFDVSLESRTWTSADGSVTLAYTVHARNAEDSTGSMTLELPAQTIEPGKAATLRVTGSAAGSRRWFGLLPVR